MRAYQSSVYVWGSTANDALGCFPIGVRVQPAPRRLALCCSTILAGEDESNAIRVIASGSGDRTTVITDKFVAYSWGGGQGRSGTERGRGEKRRGGGASRSGKSGSSCTIDRVQVEDVTTVTHGMGHSCAISSRGEVYGWGSNVHGALGVGPDNDAFGISSSSTTDRGGSRPQIISGSGNGARRVTANPHPRKLLLGDDSSKADVVAVACGEKHTCILRRDGTILTAGANDACQLGIGAACHKHGPKEKNNSGFCIIQTSVRRGLALSVAFKELSCGNNHCAALSSDDASLYTWGWGQSGRLGTGDEGCRDRPTYVEALSDLVPLATVACGSAHTLVATADGDVYGFGWNAHGQVSGAAKYDNEDDAASDICLSPVPCLTQKGVVALSCGNFHTAAVTQSGNLYMWGMNEDGQCGTGHEMPITCPSKVTFQDAGFERYAVSVSCGRSYTVCVMSTYLPLEVESLIDRLKKNLSAPETSAANVDKHTPDVNDQVIRTAEADPLPVVVTYPLPVPVVVTDPPPIEATDDLQLGDSSSLSSYSSSSDDHYILNLEGERHQKDELPQRLIEMQKMNDEDNRSAAHMAHSRKLLQLAMHAERLVMEKTRSDVENKLMYAEDVLSRMLRVHIKTDNKMKRPTRLTSEASIARDNLINKAAYRMKLVRENRQREATAKKILPVIHRRPVVKKEHKEVLNDIVNDKQMSDAELACLKRRRELVRSRELRLKKREEEEREAALKREIKKLEDQQRHQQQQRQARLNLEELMKKAEDEKKLRLLKETAELKRLEDDLRLKNRLSLPKFDENKENNSKFCDLKHWTKYLFGD